MSESSALRRFLILTALRWLPTGMMMPVFVLLPLQRGLSLSELGLALATQGVVVMVLELPTGGLADALGRRRVLLLSMVFGIASTSLFLVAHSFALFAAAAALAGIFRALDSGPLEAWYVDAAHAANPQARIDRGMGLQGTVLGVAIATGALATGALAAWPPMSTVEPLAVAVACSLALHVVGLVVTAALMLEQPRHAGLRGVLQSVREAPRTIVEGVALLRTSRVLLALVSVELFWGFGMFTFEGLFPARLAELLGGSEQAAVIAGPATSAAWIASAAGSAWLAPPRCCGSRRG